MQLAARTDFDARCAFCHDALTSGVACPRCGTLLHDECVPLLSACPTLGCGADAWSPPPNPKARPRRGRAWISFALLAVGLMSLGGAFVLREEPALVREGTAYSETERFRDEGMAAFRTWAKARRDGDRELEQRMHRRALDKLTRFLDAMNELLEPYRDADGFVKPEYEGYEEMMSEVAPYVVDLEKARPR